MLITSDSCRQNVWFSENGTCKLNSIKKEEKIKRFEEQLKENGILEKGEHIQ